MPILLKFQLCCFILGIYHQAACISVQTMNHMSITLLTTLMKIVIKHRLHVKRTVTSCHRKNTNILFNNNKILVFINNLHITILKHSIVLLGSAYTDTHTRTQGIVKTGYYLSINPYAFSFKSCLQFTATDILDISQKPFKQQAILLYLILSVITSGILIVYSHIACKDNKNRINISAD